MVTRKLALVGSGEFTPAMYDTDAYLLSLLDKEHWSRRVSILPTAAGQESDYDKWIRKGEQHFRHLKADPHGVPVLTAGDTENEQFINEVGAANLIYFSGGQPGYLCSVLKCATTSGTPIWGKVLEGYRQGKVLVGCSAGAMILGKHVLSNAEETFEGNQSPVYRPGIGLVGFTILPHYHAVQRQAPDMLRSLILGAPPEVRNRILGIEENTALVVLNEKDATVMGQGSVHMLIDGSEVVFPTGDSFLLPFPAD